MTYSTLTPDGTDSELFFKCDDQMPIYSAVNQTGHTPNGEFREGVVEFKAPDLADRLDLSPEAGCFWAAGSLADITALQELLEPYLQDPVRITQLMQEAAEAEFQFHD